MYFKWVYCFFKLLIFVLHLFFQFFIIKHHHHQQYPPYIRLNEHGQVVAGIEGHLLKILENYFNFTSILIRFENYGHKNHNGTWTGMIGEIFANVNSIHFFCWKMKKIQFHFSPILSQ